MSRGVTTSPALPLTDSRTWLRVLGAALVSATILAGLALLMPWREVAELWQRVSVAGLLAAALALGASYVASGVRLVTMLPAPDGAGTRTTLAGCISASLWHGLAMIVLPVRLGELALIDGLRRWAGVGAGRALAVLLVQRIYDLLLVALAFAVGVVALLAGHPPTMLVLAAMLLVLLAMARFLDRLLAFAARIVAGRGGDLGARLVRVLGEAELAARGLAAGRVPIVVGGTVLFWLTDFVALWLIFRAFHVVLDPLSLVFLGSGLAIVHAVPLPTIGGLGLAETGLAGLLSLTGMAPATAVGVGVSVRLTLLLLHGVVIAVGFPLLALGRGRAKRVA